MSVLVIPSVSAQSFPPPHPAVLELLPELSRVLEGNVSSQEQDRISYARDMWPKAMMWIRQGRLPPPPDLVGWPSDEAQVVEVIRLARKHQLAVVPFGAGSGVCGGTWAIRGGLALDLKRLERVGSVDAQRGEVEAQGGVVGETLERKLNAQGYTLGHFPSSMYMSTLGGWLATRSAGQLSNKYGKIEDMVVSLRAVTGEGVLRVTPRRPFAGPDLAQLLMGSEGTLCAFTGATLRVHPVPEERAFSSFQFRGIERGLEAVRGLFHAGLRPAVVRLYDPFDTALMGRMKPREEKPPPSFRGLWRGLLFPAVARQLAPHTLGRSSWLNRATDLLRHSTLVLMFEGERGRAQRDQALAQAMCRRAGGEDLGERPARHWYETRYDVSYMASVVFDSGAFVDTMEVATTWDRVVDVYHRVRAAVSPYAFVLCHFSHAYLEGCSLYFSLVGSDTTESAMEARYDQMWRAASTAAMSAGATVSHHHGIGLLKQDQLRDELGDGRRLLGALKKTFDPDGIMNPGKMGQ